MTQPKPRNNFTYQDYKTAPEDKRYELLEGELLLVPAPTTHHQMISRRLFMGLEIFVTSQGLGEIFYSPCDVVLSNYDVVQPDLLFVSNARSHIITPDNIQGGPDLLVGILSPSTADRDLGYKRDPLCPVWCRRVLDCRPGSADCGSAHAGPGWVRPGGPIWP